jgi:hypothetical protein
MSLQNSTTPAKERQVEWGRSDLTLVQYRADRNWTPAFAGVVRLELGRKW